MIRVFFLRGAFAALLPVLAWLVPVRCDAQLSLFSAVDLAKRNSQAVRIAQSDVVRAQSALSETRDAYLPALSVGSSVGYSYGFPIGQPSIYNFQAQSLAISFSQPDYIRAARTAMHTATLQLRDSLDQVELDVSLDYLQLSTMERQLVALKQEKTYADRLILIEQDRASAGVESQIAGTRAEISAEQADLKRLDLEGQAAVLRQRLSYLLGLPEETIEPEPETVPGSPSDAEQPLHQRVASVDAAFSNAQSKRLLAHGDQEQIFRPQIGFALAYSRYSNINNYGQYYLNFQQNNFGVGLQITFPIFDAVRAAHARTTAAEAVHAEAQAQQSRQEANTNVTQLEKSLPLLRAQARIADLQAQLASQQLQSVLLQLQHPPAAPNGLPLTPADEMEARIEERTRFSDALEAHYALLKSQLSLLRATGGLENWINTGAR